MSQQEKKALFAVIPADEHKRLKAEAAQAGVSLGGYLMLCHRERWAAQDAKRGGGAK